MDAEKFLKLVTENGGAITSANELSTEEINEAFAANHCFVDGDGNAYVYQSFE